MILHKKNGKHPLIRVILKTILFMAVFLLTSVISKPADAFSYDTSLKRLASYYYRDQSEPLLKNSYYPSKNGIWSKKSLRFSIIDRMRYDQALRCMIDDDIAHFSLLSKLQTKAHSFVITSGPALSIADRTALCMFTGDIMCLKGQQYSARTNQGYDFWPSYCFVSSLFDHADLVCGNLETLISRSNPLTSEQVYAENGQPLCHGPEELLRALKKAGYDVLVTANNHAYDWGITGVNETKKQLDMYGFANTGTSYSNDTYDLPSSDNRNYLIIDVNGIKMAILSCTYPCNQREQFIQDGSPSVINLYDIDMIRNNIVSAKAEGAEFVTVYCHWGIENTEELNYAQINGSREIAEAGADLIIGSHPHCLQGCEYIKTSDDRNVLCMYSMGNFCSSMSRIINNDTIILSVTLSFEKNSDRPVISSASYIPCRVTSYRGHLNVVIPTDPEINGGHSSSDLTEAACRIEEVINGVLPVYNGVHPF